MRSCYVTASNHAFGPHVRFHTQSRMPDETLNFDYDRLGILVSCSDSITRVYEGRAGRKGHTNSKKPHQWPQTLNPPGK